MYGRPRTSGVVLLAAGAVVGTGIASPDQEIARAGLCPRAWVISQDQVSRPVDRALRPRPVDHLQVHPENWMTGWLSTPEGTYLMCGRIEISFSCSLTSEGSFTVVPEPHEPLVGVVIAAPSPEGTHNDTVAPSAEPATQANTAPTAVISNTIRLIRTAPSMVYIEQAGQAYAHAEVAARSLRRDPVFRFAHFLQPTEDRGCTVGSFAETTAYHRSKDIGVTYTASSQPVSTRTGAGQGLNRRLGARTGTGPAGRGELVQPL